jgi:hypothetical protein
MTMTDTREMLSALIDRESVDPDVLAGLLEDPANRTILVDFVRVRQAIGTDYESAQTTPERRRDRAYGVWPRLAAALLLVAMSASVGAWLQHYSSIERPPVPVRVVRLDPVDQR